MDFSLWDLVNDFDLTTAACLWAETEPVGWAEKLPPAPNAIHTALFEAARQGDIKTRREGYFLYVTRQELTRWAQAKGHRPAFLFREARQPAPIEAATAQDNLSPKERKVWAKLVKVLCQQARVDLAHPYEAATVITQWAAQ
jgi:hypothetical protein